MAPLSESEPGAVPGGHDEECGLIGLEKIRSQLKWSSVPGGAAASALTNARATCIAMVTGVSSKASKSGRIGQ